MATDLLNRIILRDSTLREGQDTPGVSFSCDQKLNIARALAQAGVPEIEIVAPSRVLKDLEAVKNIRDSGLQLETSGLIYAHSTRVVEEIKEAGKCLHRFDLLMPVSAKREPFDRQAKISMLLDALEVALSLESRAGVGFPHSTQTEVEFLLEIAHKAVDRGAARLTIYDTNGSAEPFFIYNLIGRIRTEVRVPVFFHAHNDLGLATANALAAAR